MTQVAVLVRRKISHVLGIRRMNGDNADMRPPLPRDIRYCTYLKGLAVPHWRCGHER